MGSLFLDDCTFRDDDEYIRLGISPCPVPPLFLFGARASTHKEYFTIFAHLTPHLHPLQSPMSCLLCGKGAFQTLYDLHVHFVDCFEDHVPVSVARETEDAGEVGEKIAFGPETTENRLYWQMYHWGSNGHSSFFPLVFLGFLICSPSIFQH